MSWYSLQRGWMDNPMFKKEPYTKAQAWCYLIENSAYADYKKVIGNQVIHLKRGEYYCSQRYLAEAWMWTRKKVRGFLELLEKNESLVSKRAQEGTIIIIVNYLKYQNNLTGEELQGPQKGPQRAQTGPTSGPKNNKSNNINKDIEEKTTSKKGSRISEDWNPTTELVEAIAEKENTSTEWVKSQVYKFVNHFAGLSGAKAVKLKWDLTFRNWCNNSFDEKPSRMTNGSAEKWDIRLLGFMNNGLWHESFGPMPTTDGKPDGPLNVECGAYIDDPDLVKKLFKRGPLI